MYVGTQLLGRDILRKINESEDQIPWEQTERFLREAELAFSTQVPRRVPVTQNLICFCDASALAQAALIFNDRGQLLQGRGSLASRPPQTIPREELNAMVLVVESVANLVSDIESVLPQPIVKRIIVLSDSLITIQRLRKFKKVGSLDFYERNRIAKIINICTLKDHVEWIFHHIAGDINPADFPSRLQSLDFTNYQFPGQVARILAGGPPPLEEDKAFAFANYSKEELQLSRIINTFGELKTEEVNSISREADIALSDAFPCFMKTPEEMRKEIAVAQKDSGIGDGSELIRNQGKIIVPSQIAQTVVEYVHVHSGHFGHSNLLKVLGRDYSIKSLSRLCYDCVRRCPLCQVFKGSRHFSKSDGTSNKWDDSSLIQGSWVTVGLDIYKFFNFPVLTVTDLLSRVIAVIVVYESGSKGYTSRDLANAFEKLCYRTGFGFPSVVYSDNESTFSAEFKSFLIKAGSQPRTISPYSPFSSFWERLHSEIGKEVKVLANRKPSTGREFQTVLDKAAFIINRRPVTDKLSAIEVFMLRFKGRSYRDLAHHYEDFRPPDKVQLSRELERSLAEYDKMYDEYLKSYRKERKRSANGKGKKRFRASGPFLPGDDVLVFNHSGQKTDQKWQFPPKQIVRRVGLKHYELEDGKIHHEYNLKRYIH